MASSLVEKPEDQSLADAPRKVSPSTETAGAIKYKVEYISTISGQTASFEGKGDRSNILEPPVLEYVDVRKTDEFTDSARLGEKTKADLQSDSKGHAYIKILSPAVCEALRCVVDYFPKVDLSGDVIKIYEPFEIFIFFERELTEYRNRLESCAAEAVPTSCANRFAHKHIGIAQDFVKERVQAAIDAERERHARGYLTFDMLWLLFKPGCDVYFDFANVGEHDPHVVMNVDFELTNGATNTYNISCWSMNANSEWVGPASCNRDIERFSGEKEITSLLIYPCEYLRFKKGLDEGDLKAIKDHFIRRGRHWYGLRRKKNCYAFDGVSTTFPRRTFVSRVMVDPIQYVFWTGFDSHEVGVERATLLESIAHPSNPLKICSCDRCEKLIYRYTVKPKFAGYSHINPLVVEQLTDHQYFLCDKMVEAFVFKVRGWEHLHISGFEDPFFDKALFDRLVLKEDVKELIKNLTQMYIRDSVRPSLQEEKGFINITTVHKAAKLKKQDTTWSADFVQGKGEGLTFLLHGKPGVGKTYTAECIADFTGRPLLFLTCADIGVEPSKIEGNLLRWFQMAESWGAIMLIDEADIYMEERQVQDVKRNHLVAAFIRALEYFKGILFLTTNRVGIFDEAFISRIHIQIYYAEFQDEDRVKVWDTFFEKLEDERETTMRIQQSTKDYTQSEELRVLKWNGREIRNAFQIAVALAEAQGQKDKEGRTLIKPDHIKATVQMSKEFKEYLSQVHKLDLSKRAAMFGHRYDAYGLNSSSRQGGGETGT